MVNFHLPMPIVTQRLTLGPLSLADSPAMFDARRESYAELAKWGTLIWGSLDDMAIEENDHFCRMKLAQFESGADMTIIAYDSQTGHLIGGGGLHKCDWVNRIFSLGYWVRSSETNKGYATEMATALIEYAFTVLGATKVTASHGDGNVTSQHILEKLGFQRLSISRNAYKMMDGPMIDDYLYSLTPSSVTTKD